MNLGKQHNKHILTYVERIVELSETEKGIDTLMIGVSIFNESEFIEYFKINELDKVILFTFYMNLKNLFELYDLTIETNLDTQSLLNFDYNRILDSLETISLDRFDFSLSMRCELFLIEYAA